MSRRAVLAAGPSLALAGCGRASDPDALTLWAMGYEGDYAPWLMPAFTQATGLAVEVQSLPWTAAHEKLLTAFAGGSLPDVLMLPNGWVGEFAMIGALAPLDDPRLVADMFPGVIETTRYAGHDYAVPWAVGPNMQYYRRDLLAAAGYAEPPGDWAAWRAMAVKLKRRRPDDWVVLIFLNWWDTLFTFAGQAGATMLRERETRGNFATPEFREALVFYKSLFDLGLAPRALSTEIQDPFGAFAQGLFAIYPNGPPLLTDLKRRAAELGPERWGVARMPGPRGPGPATSVSASLAVSSRTHRPQAARALLRHLTSVTSELTFQRMIGILPARRSAWRDPQLATARLAPFGAQMRDPAPSPNIVEWERVRVEVQLVAERVVRGATTIAAGLAEMDLRVDRLLARRRALVQAGKVA